MGTQVPLDQESFSPVFRGTSTVGVRSPRLAGLWPTARIEGDQIAIPAVIMRGGTSRGVFFRADDLPTDPAASNQVILAVFGSPDDRQIDGIGGATPLTSKVAIVSRSAEAGADVDFQFGQVRIDAARIDFAGNCGNMLSAVGPFAIDEGLVAPIAPVTDVRIRLVNTGQIVSMQVPVARERARTIGGTAIPGVPRPGAAVVVEYAGLAASLGAGILPSGYASEELELDGFEHVVSLVDAGNPCVFVRAAEFGFGTNTPLIGTDLDGAVMERLLAIRAVAAVRLDLAESSADAMVESPAIPKVYLVSPPAAYVARDGETVAEGDTDVLARGLSMGVPHPAIASTVAVCVATAARIPGTVVAAAARLAGDGRVRVGHPSGVVEVDVSVDLPYEPRLRRASMVRTARRLMAGDAYVPMSVLIR